MKLLMYEGVSHEDESVCFLQLIRCGTEIIVVAVDNFGEEITGGTLVRFYPNGTFTRCKKVNEKLGFQLDSEGRIKQNG